MKSSPFVGDKPLDSISLCFYGDSTGIRIWNNPNDPMPIKIANGKTLEQCVFYRGGGITVYTDNSVTVKSYPGFYDYYLANERKMSEVMLLPVEGEEVAKDEEYYKKLINGLAVDYNKQVENAPNLYRGAMVLQDVNTPAPIDFACTVFVDKIWIGEGYSVGTADRPPCPVNVPIGKLAFVTQATSETHSFVMDIVETEGNTFGNTLFYSCGAKAIGDFERPTALTKESLKGKALTSKSYAKYIYPTGEVDFAYVNKGLTSGTIYFANNDNNQNRKSVNIFSQLLIYKANLTETELKAELAKDIKLK
ncbi:MAG: hypothetical protein ACRDD8_14065 [Bacteroidales bacterium]